MCARVLSHVKYVSLMCDTSGNAVLLGIIRRREFETGEAGNTCGRSSRAAANYRKHPDRKIVRFIPMKMYAWSKTHKMPSLRYIHSMKNT